MAAELAAPLLDNPASAAADQGGARPKIAKVGVLGSGVMGAGIAAHVANAGVPVVLLDIVPAGRNGPQRARRRRRRADGQAASRRR